MSLSTLTKLTHLLDKLHETDVADYLANPLSDEDLADLGTVLDRLQKEAKARLDLAKVLVRERAREEHERTRAASPVIRGALGAVQVCFKAAQLEAVDELYTHRAELPAGLYAKFFVEKVTVAPVKGFRDLLGTIDDHLRPLVTRWTTEKETEPSVTFPK